MACDVDYGKLCAQAFSSNCVSWEGPDIPCLGITRKMSLTNIELIVAEKLCALVGSTNVSSVTLCGEFITLLGSNNKSLSNLLQILIDYGCTLKELITALEAKVNDMDGLILDFKCLTISTDPCEDPEITIQFVLQLIINNLCNLRTEIDELKNTVNTTVNNTVGTILGNLFQSCQTGRITKTGSGIDTKLTIRGLLWPGCILPYAGNMSYFDATGLGLTDTPACGTALCNGNNGTIDMRGRVPVCSVASMGGGALHAQVNPANNNGSGNYSIGDIGGEMFHVSTINEMPSHTHGSGGSSGGSSSHTHALATLPIPVYDAETTVGSGVFLLGLIDKVNTPTWQSIINNTGYLASTEPATVTVGGSTITIDPMGGGQAHENRMPYKAVAYIMILS